MPRTFHRKNIRLRAGNYVGQKLYLVTLCFSNRRRLGATPAIASWLIERLRFHSAKCSFHAHAYCVMPDHMHVLVEGSNAGSDLIKFIESFKKETGFQFSADAGKRLWQFKYYDHVVRTGEAADRIAWYIWMNPVRQGLCSAPQDYPFSGSFTEVGVAMLQKPSAQEWTPPWKAAT